MNKKLIRLTESDLHRIVRESVNKVLNEIGDTNRGQYLMGRAEARARKIGDDDMGGQLSMAAAKSKNVEPYAYMDGYSDQAEYMDAVDKHGRDKARYAEGGYMDIRRNTDKYNRIDFKNRRNAAREKYRFMK